MKLVIMWASQGSGKSTLLHQLYAARPALKQVNDFASFSELHTDIGAAEHAKGVTLGMPGCQHLRRTSSNGGLYVVGSAPCDSSASSRRLYRLLDTDSLLPLANDGTLFKRWNKYKASWEEGLVSLMLAGCFHCDLVVVTQVPALPKAVSELSYPLQRETAVIRFTLPNREIAERLLSRSSHRAYDLVLDRFASSLKSTPGYRFDPIRDQLKDGSWPESVYTSVYKLGQTKYLSDCFQQALDNATEAFEEEVNHE